MGKNIYEYYNVENKEQLLKKVKTEPESVKELLDLMEYLKRDKSQGIKLSDVGKMNRFLESENFEKDKTYIVGCDADLNLKNITKIIDESFKKIVKESLRNNYKSIFIIEAKPISETIPNRFIRKHNRLKEKLEDFEINLCDSLIVDNNIYFSALQNLYNKLEKPSLKLQEEIKSYNHQKLDKGLYEKYTDFLDYYVSEELKGLSIKKDDDKINELLKIKNSEKETESFTVLMIGKNNRIINEKKYQEGTVDRSIIYVREVMKDILNTKGVKGVILSHNHPAGTKEPSRADNILTNKLKKLMNSVDIKLYDHIIVTRQGNYNYKDFREMDEILESIYDEKVENNKKIALELIAENPKYFEKISDELKDDKEIVLEAIKKDAMTIKFASERLKNDPEVIFSVMIENTEAMKFLNISNNDIKVEKINENKNLKENEICK